MSTWPAVVWTIGAVVAIALSAIYLFMNLPDLRATKGDPLSHTYAVGRILVAIVLALIAVDLVIAGIAVLYLPPGHLKGLFVLYDMLCIPWMAGVLLTLLITNKRRVQRSVEKQGR